MNAAQAPGANALPTQLPTGWLPDFLSARALLMLMSAAEMIVLIALVVGSRPAEPFWPAFWARFGAASLFAQWLAICAAFALALLRPRLSRLPTAASAIGALLLVGGTTFLCVLLASSAQAVIAPADAATLTPAFAARIAFVAVLVTAGALRYSYVQRLWALEVQASARVKVEALTARIRPHFLFNSMNTLASLIAIDPERAEQVVEDLSELFRAALKAGEHEVTLGEELELARHYLRIEQLRLGPRLSVQFDIEDAPLAFKIPALLLQPLVENAVYHGIQPLEAGGCVHLQVQQLPNALRICIDNPMPVASGAAIAKTLGHGMAQDNIRARLRLAFGPSARLQILQNESSAATTQYRVVLHIPTASQFR